jgi:hypothetical protein
MSAAVCDEPRDAGSSYRIEPLSRLDGIDLFQCVDGEKGKVEILLGAIRSLRRR